MSINIKAHRGRAAAVLAAVTCATVLAGVAPARAATATYCGITWGSLPKSAPELTASPIAGARVGRHDCYDRLVIDLAGQPAPGYFANYIDGYFNQDTGERVPVAGGAILKVRVLAPGHDANYQPTVPWKFGTHIVTPEQFSAGGFRTFRDLVYGATYEGETDFVVGLRARLPFRVLKLDGPGGGSRLIIDVAHQW